MMEMFRRAHAHRGAAFVEVFQNCNVFNDGAFDGILKRDVRADMIIPLEDGEPIRFGEDNQHGVAINKFGEPYVCESVKVGVDHLLTHDESRDDPTLAFALSRLSTGPHMPTPIGVFRDVQRSTYEAEVQAQVASSIADSGPGNLHDLLHSGSVWTVS